MTRLMMLWALASLVLLVSPAVLAGRVPVAALEEGGWMPFSGDAAALRAMMYGARHHVGKGEKEDARAIVAFKFIVPPCEKDGFIEAWQKLEKETTKEKGLILYDLKKTEIDNFMFLEYGEWECQDDFVNHFMSKYAEDFTCYCAEHGIVWLMKPLKSMVDDPDAPSHGKRGTGKHGDKLAHVHFRWYVPADKHEDFLGMFQSTAEETWKEEGNHIYSLRKTITDNVEFCGYGTWETMDDYVQHFKSDHVRELRKFARENDIVWMLSPVYKIGDEPELAF